MARVTGNIDASPVRRVLGFDGERRVTAPWVKLRHRLGWRLTASYAVVTVAVLLVIELVLLAGGSILVAVALHRNGPTISADLQLEADGRMSSLFPAGVADLSGID